MVSNHSEDMVSLHCKKCCTELAKRDILMIARMPPSQQHLAVKEGKEEKAYTKVSKLDNPNSGRSAKYCPFLVYCRKCGNHVGNVTYVASKLLICYKVENFYLSNGVEKIAANKLSKLIRRLQQLGIEEIKYLPSENTGHIQQSSQPVIYCDITGLTFASQEINSLTREIPRNYQRELFLTVMRGNTLVYLPTGSGKTLIAAMVFSCMKLLNPRKLMVFIVDRVPLAYQQSAYFKYQLPHLRIETLTGEMVPFQKKNVHQGLTDRTVDILVLTHQILLDNIAMENSAIRLVDISVLVFDEAHHCTGGHPYNKIMNDFYSNVTPDSFKPVVLGLTASPAGDITAERTVEKLQNLLKNLHCTVAMPKESDDLVAHVNAPNTSYDIVIANAAQVVLERLIMEHVTDLQVSHIESTPGCKQALRGLNIFSGQFKGALRNLIERCHGDSGKIKVLIVGEHIMRMLSIVDVGKVLSPKDALMCLNDYLNNVIQAISPNDSALNKWIGRNQTFEALREHTVEKVKDDYCMSDRYRCLEKRISQFICRVKEDITSRGIIFVGMRKTAFKLCERLRVNTEISKLLNPAAFVGHGSGAYDGMNWQDEQEVLLQDFRSGGIKLLISTSVLEEGLDVPVCNLVVRFEGAATLRAFVQSRGRASRRPGSEFIVICNEKEKAEAMNLIEQEENMKNAVAFVMDNESVKLQAQEFQCEARRPTFAMTEVRNVKRSPHLQRYNPTIKVLVQYFEGLEESGEKLKVVTDLLETSFNVKPTNLNPAQSCSRENKGTSEMTFMLQKKDNIMQEFRSKADFIVHVTQVWCSMGTDGPDEPLPAWLHPFIPQKSRKLMEPLQILHANSLFLGTFVNRSQFQYEWPSDPDVLLRKVEMRFDHSFNMLTISFKLRRRIYKLEVRYDELGDFVLVDNNTANDQMTRVFFSVRHPPKVYQIVDEDIDGDIDGNNDGNGDSDDDFTQDEGIDDEVSDSESSHFSTDDEYPDVIRNSHDRSAPVLQDGVDSSWITRSWERVVDVEGGEEAWGQCFTYCFRLPWKESMTFQSLLFTLDERYGKKAFYSRIKNTYGKFPDINIPDELDFDVKYHTQSILKSNPSLRGRLDESHLRDLLRNRNPKEVVTCLEQWRKALEQDPFCSPETTLHTLLTRRYGLHTNPSLVPNHCALIKRVVITPTRVLLYPAEVMVKNRVLRNYPAGDFICVSIREENLSKLSMGRGSIDLLLDNINLILNWGLNVGGKRFHFLGSSNSQLRNHSCWFVGPSCSADELRRWMGDFEPIKCVAKYMARMGQCFSTSVDSVVEAREDIMFSEEEDVMTVDEEYCFSDGVGRISETLAIEVSKMLGKPFTPSAFQIRFAGYKGVLAVDPTLAGRRASFRPSMRKFESNHKRLEVTHTSRPQAVYLNHQVIMLLSNLGVPDEAFINLQKEMLDSLAAMLVTENAALQYLNSGTKMGMSYQALSNAGVQLTTEPFFKSLLVAMHRNHTHDLLSRARIRLPPEEARLMMGVLDETGVLNPGEVFVQYSAVSKEQDQENEFNRNDKRCHVGPVVVTRNPCLHPGDVRQLEAVNAPSLSHFVDCIVFSRHGLRPSPNEMSGGDLDGDLYFVCWKQSFLPSKQNFPPMNYKKQEEKRELEPITSAHMTKFVVDYIRSDQLGVIDNAHKAIADQERDGIQSDICLHLAELHSLAVDAPKTGNWPKIPDTKVKEYPDFMMKSDKPSYPSENLLGKLYRGCEKFKDTTSENCNQKMRIDESFLLPGYEKYVTKARELYQQYRDKMESLMRLYGIQSEAEIFTGCFLKLRNRLPKEKSKIKDIVIDMVIGIRKEFRREFFNEFGMDDQTLPRNAEIPEEVYLKASAWYEATYTFEENWEQLQAKRLLGLPWIVDDVMSIIKSQQQSPKTLNVNDAVGKSLVRLFDEEKTRLLDEIKMRIRVKESIDSHICSLKPNMVTCFAGSSRTLLFHNKSNLDLCVLPKNCQTSGISIDIAAQKKNLESLVCHLEADEQNSGDEEVKNLFYEARLRSNKNFPIIACNQPTEKLTTTTQCTSDLVCNINSSKVSLLVGMLLSAFVKSHPHLLLILRVIHRWCHVTGLSRNSKDVDSTSNLLNILFLAHCIHRGEMKRFQEDLKLEMSVQHLADQERNVNLCTMLEKVIDTFGNETKAVCGEEARSPAKLGCMLMSFFQSCETSFDMVIPETFARILGGQCVSKLIDYDHLALIQDHMQRSYQLLAQHGDVQIMLACSGSENYKVIFLSPLLSYSVSGVKKSKAREIATKTGAASVIIRTNVPRSRKSAILEVRGNEPAIRAVHRELAKLTIQLASGDKWSLMSGCFVDGSNMMLFEGSKSVKDIITLTPYNGPCNQTHDGLARHLAFVKNPHPRDTQYMFSRFTEKFALQFQVLQRDFVPELHGVYELAVHFGRMYLFGIPHLLLEDSESVSIAMLKTNKFKLGIKQGEPRKVPSEIRYVNPEFDRERRRNRMQKNGIKTDEQRKTRRRSKPSRSSFFTVVYSVDGVEGFLRSLGFQPDEANYTETYSVNIYHEDTEFYVKFDGALRFTEVRFPNLRWCVTDVKRKWQKRGNHANRPVCEQGEEELLLDGCEIDMRFLLQSRLTLNRDEIFGTKYERYINILKPSDDPHKPFIVDENLWKELVNIRFRKARIFKSCTDVPDDFLSDLTVYLDEVKELSRPCEQAGVFKTDITRSEVCLKTSVPVDFETKKTQRNYLGKLWNFAFALSSCVSEF